MTAKVGVWAAALVLLVPAGAYAPDPPQWERHFVDMFGNPVVRRGFPSDRRPQTVIELIGEPRYRELLATRGLVVDYACGSRAVFVRHLISSGVNAVGVDIFPPPEGVPVFQADLLKPTAARLFPPGSVQNAISVKGPLTIEGFSDAERVAMLRNIHSHLADGGRVTVCSFHPDDMKPFCRLAVAQGFDCRVERFVEGVFTSYRVTLSKANPFAKIPPQSVPPVRNCGDLGMPINSAVGTSMAVGAGVAGYAVGWYGLYAGAGGAEAWRKGEVAWMNQKERSLAFLEWRSRNDRKWDSQWEGSAEHKAGLRQEFLGTPEARDRYGVAELRTFGWGWANTLISIRFTNGMTSERIVDWKEKKVRAITWGGIWTWQDPSKYLPEGYELHRP